MTSQEANVCRRSCHVKSSISASSKAAWNLRRARNRATFYTSLATIADLKCKVTLTEADEALKPAFDAARKAEASRSFYQGAVQWSEAGFIATQVVPMLMKQLSAPPK
jgi:hypothetical protein